MGIILRTATVGFAVGFATLTLLACADAHCRRKAEVAQVVSPVNADAPKTASAKDAKVRVYKYDGSLQCQSGKGVAVEKMAEDLKGIAIFSQQKKPDGLMHIQVCGSGTGRANVYEILETDLPKAEKVGFKKWNFE
jgi:hypothetical protein